MVRLASVVALMVALGACATTNASGTAEIGAAKAAIAVPPNYRQLIARKLATSTDLRKLRKAEISQPGEGWRGVFNGGTRPIVCAALTVEGKIIQQSYVVGYTFQNGQIDEVFYPGAYNPMQGAVGAAIESALTCDKLAYSPFPELTASR
jgi:hypothetical protein